jgi:hypothetical protein
VTVYLQSSKSDLYAPAGDDSQAEVGREVIRMPSGNHHEAAVKVK